MDILTIKSQIKSPYFNMILKIAKSSQNDLKSDFVKSSIKSLNTLQTSQRNHQNVTHGSTQVDTARDAATG
jgi:hypothetical protein